MKKIYSCFLLILLGSPTFSFAAKTLEEGTIHLSKLSLAYPGAITAEYVSCENGPDCINPTTHSIVVAQDGNQKFQLLGVETFFVSLKTQDGKVIWGPHLAQYGKNACSTVRDSNSFTFNLNSDDSITCIPGMN